MNPTNKQGLREQIRKTSNAACNSVAEDGSFNTDEYLSEETRLIALITAHTNAEIAKVLKTILKSYPKKNRTMNDTSKLTRADIDRMITELKESNNE